MNYNVIEVGGRTYLQYKDHLLDGLNNNELEYNK